MHVWEREQRLEISRAESDSARESESRIPILESQYFLLVDKSQKSNNSKGALAKSHVEKDSPECRRPQISSLE